ncbi:GNAT family N-acetyltransferase [Kosmotoga pacifica]|uniref:N-acetyltransferase domain-containing protein n=1 Tax=Kosmotoga pacifica TaxID=1330330 RepID=A0A0G2ZC88_9BACT|nr:GNAT family N-acetyltransferase [Kosmotoga pacifica]AKI97706.1 hypothetical protein IX53_07630 [Kosmotoga pacifica]
MNIKIRPMELEDFAAWAEIRNLPLASSFTLGIPYISKEEAKKRVEAAVSDRSVVNIVAEVDDKVVGFAGIHFKRGRRRHTAEIGMMVHDGYQGKGIGTELMKRLIDLADNWYNIHRIQLEVYVDNERAIRLYKKFGFVIEGTLKDFAFRNGKYVDAYVMARIKD